MDKDILIASLCTYMRILSIRVQMTSLSRASIVEMFDGHAVWVTGVQGNEGGRREEVGYRNVPASKKRSSSTSVIKRFLKLIYILRPKTLGNKKNGR